MTPNTRRGADEPATANEQRLEHDAAKPAEQIKPREFLVAPRMFEPRAKDVQAVHVRDEMPQSGVHEHVRDGRPPTPRQRAGIEAEPRRHVLVRHDGHLQERHRDVDRDERLDAWCQTRISYS
jgi:hypothetical protein